MARDPSGHSVRGLISGGYSVYQMSELEPQRPAQRASNADREQVAKILQDAAAENRISFDELAERLDATYAAKTLAELEPLTADLPAGSSVLPAFSAPSSAVRIGGTPGPGTSIAIFGGSEKKGTWVVPTDHKAIAVMGGVDLDLTDATFAEREVTITAFAMFGGIDITVPDDVTVNVHGIGIFGGFSSRDYQGPPGAPVINVKGLALFGGVDVHRAKKNRNRAIDS